MDRYPSFLGVEMGRGGSHLLGPFFEFRGIGHGSSMCVDVANVHLQVHLNVKW
jgi:hypothetical protein